MFERFTDSARRVVVLAQEEARVHGHNEIGIAHLLLALSRGDDPYAAATLTTVGADYSRIADTVRDVHGAGRATPGASVPFAAGAKKVLEMSLREALQLGHNHIGPEHLLLGLTRDDSGATSALFESLDITVQAVRTEILRRLVEAAPTAAAGPAASPNTPGPLRALDTFGRNLTAAAHAGRLDPLVGRETELLRVMQILTRRTKNNPVLVGEPGVGKTAIIEGLAQRIATGAVPTSLRDKQLYLIDLGAMVAGTRFRGDFEERVKKVLTEATERGDVLLFIDEIHTLVGAGSAEGSLDAANMVKPLLARGELQLIGATTTDEFRTIEDDAALERRFAPVTVAAPGVAETVMILRGLRERFEDHHQVPITDAALEAAARLADRYIPDRQLPDKAIDLVDEAASRLRLVRELPTVDTDAVLGRINEARDARDDARRDRNVQRVAELADEIALLESQWQTLRDLVESGASREVGPDQIAEALAAWTGIPAHQLRAGEMSRLAGLETELHRRVIGQHDAVTAVARAVRRARAGVRDPHRPAGSFLFLGPTGVGKTELARALAHELFGDGDALVRVDMSEYMERHTTARLVGSPPGYVGHDDGGQLTEAVRRKPWSVVLLDEIEKAHPDVANILLQVLDDGRLTDGQGRTVDFRNTFIIMTSNLGSDALARRGVGFRTDDPATRAARVSVEVRDALKRHFRPELVNRIDETVVFHPLERSEIEVIVDKFAGELAERLTAQGLGLEMTASALGHLAAVGFDPESGARPLRRVFQRLVEDPVAEGVVNGTYRAGDHLVVDTELGEDGAVTVGVRASLPDTFPDLTA